MPPLAIVYLESHLILRKRSFVFVFVMNNLTNLSLKYQTVKCSKDVHKGPVYQKIMLFSISKHLWDNFLQISIRITLNIIVTVQHFKRRSINFYTCELFCVDLVLIFYPGCKLWKLLVEGILETFGKSKIIVLALWNKNWF